MIPMIDVIRQGPGSGAYWMDQMIQEKELAYAMHEVIQNLIYMNISLYLSMNGLTGLTLEPSRISGVDNNEI